MSSRQLAVGSRQEIRRSLPVARKGGGLLHTAYSALPTGEVEA